MTSCLYCPFHASFSLLIFPVEHFAQMLHTTCKTFYSPVRSAQSHPSRPPKAQVFQTCWFFSLLHPGMERHRHWAYVADLVAGVQVYLHVSRAFEETSVTYLVIGAGISLFWEKSQWLEVVHPGVSGCYKRDFRSSLPNLFDCPQTDFSTVGVKHLRCSSLPGPTESSDLHYLGRLEVIQNASRQAFTKPLPFIGIWCDSMYMSLKLFKAIGKESSLFFKSLLPASV